MRRTVDHTRPCDMKPRSKHLVALAVAISFLGGACATLVPHTPDPVDPSSVHKQLRETLNAQIHPPLKIEITDTDLKIIRDRGGTLQVWVIRFKDLGDVTLYDVRGRYYSVLVLNRNGEQVYKYEGKDRSEAERFVDALHALRLER
jgi:hypothetical protein